MKRLADPNVLACAAQVGNALKAQKEQPAMEYGAIDLHARHSLIRIVDVDGRVMLDQRIATTAEAFQRVFAGRALVRVLVETGTDSEWVATVVEGCGSTVIVVDPNYALMYGHRQRRIKTDRRDVAALAEACRLGIYRAAHRVSAAQRERRRRLRVRERLLRMRTQAINLLRAQLRQEGYRLGSGSAESVPTRYARVAVPAGLQAALQPILDLLTQLQPVRARLDAEMATAAAADPVVRRLMTAPGVGPITAFSFRATVDDVSRFRDASSAAAFFGLVPYEDSSGERQRRGRITKAGPSGPRSLLIQAAWVVWRYRGTAGGALQTWVQCLADRRGKRIAVVALARRLTRILYAMWRDDTVYTVTPARVAA
jgi:transposase